MTITLRDFLGIVVHLPLLIVGLVLGVSFPSLSYSQEDAELQNIVPLIEDDATDPRNEPVPQPSPAQNSPREVPSPPSTTPAPERGLQETSETRNPLKARRPQQLSGKLHSSPDEQSSSYREIQADDKVEVLRSQGPWFEVDVTSAQGFQFRGWVKSEALPMPQKDLPELDRAAPSSAQRSALDSEKYFWIGSDRIEEKFSLAIQVGFTNLTNSIAGTPSSGTNSPIDYSFNGFSLLVDSDLVLLETPAWGPEFRWLLDLRYRFAFFQVEFGNAAAIPVDIRGAGYNVRNQNLRFVTRSDFRVAYWRSGFYRVGLGAGFFFSEIAPDLKRTQLGNVVFTSLTWMGPLLQLDHQIQFFDRFRVSNTFGVVLFPSVSESPDVDVSGSLKNSGFPLYFSGKFEYRWTRFFSLQGSGEYLLAAAKHSGESTRVNQNFNNVKFDVSHWQLGAGAGFHF